MVNQNFVLYVNSKKVLKTVPLSVSSLGGFSMSFCVPEDHLICGLIIQGVPIKGEKLRNFPLKPIEKYLFEFSNIHFFISDNEYTVENTCYNWVLDFQFETWLSSVVDSQTPVYAFNIQNFNQSTGLQFENLLQINPMDVVRLKHYDNTGQLLNEYLTSIQDLIDTYGEFGPVYNYEINRPFTGYFEITDSVSNVISNRYYLPQ